MACLILNGHSVSEPTPILAIDLPARSFYNETGLSGNLFNGLIRFLPYFLLEKVETSELCSKLITLGRFRPILRLISSIWPLNRDATQKPSVGLSHLVTELGSSAAVLTIPPSIMDWQNFGNRYEGHMSCKHGHIT